MALNAKLVVVGGDVKTTEIALRLPSTIGRGRGTTIVLPHPLVSRQHCELYESGGQLMVRDLGSLNGTFVNNQRITESPLPPGELLTIGTVTFRAVYEASDEAPRGASPAKAAAAGRADKTIKVDKDQTATAPRAAHPADEAEGGDEIDFSFDRPLLPADDAELPAGADALRATERFTPGPAEESVAEDASAEEILGEQGLSDDDEEEPVSAASDEDLNDFLKNLGS
jgi:predicted component of type VI protein secretion system